jgi:hypothetical protein
LLQRRDINCGINDLTGGDRAGMFLDVAATMCELDACDWGCCQCAVDFNGPFHALLVVVQRRSHAPRFVIRTQRWRRWCC